MKSQSTDVAARADLPEPMTFQWPLKRRVSLSLIGFVALSALLHALTFYIFRVEYPPTAHISPPPAQVSLLTAGSAENDALLRWIDSEDPALAAKPQELVPQNLLDVSYSPSYAEVRAVPKTADKQAQAFVYPSVKSGIALAESVLPRNQAAATSAPIVPKTRVRFSEGLAVRAPENSSPENLRARDFASAVDLRPARFLIGVSSGGDVRYIFLQRSSGDPSLDEQADDCLRETKFARGSGDADALDWGFAIFFWGDDVLAGLPQNAPAQQSAPSK